MVSGTFSRACLGTDGSLSSSVAWECSAVCTESMAMGVLNGFTDMSEQLQPFLGDEAMAIKRQ